MSPARILSGKSLSNSIYVSLESRIHTLRQKGVEPGLAVVMVGDDPASQVYVRSKTRKFKELQLFSETFNFSADTPENDILDLIARLNSKDNYHGILIQLPLPDHINSLRILESVDPKKDVDGFHPANLGRLAMGIPRFIPCTPKGIMRIFEHYQITLAEKHIVVIGRSNIVGRPLSILTSLKNKNGNATTTLCHSQTPDIPKFSLEADIVIAAIGVPNFIDESFIKPGAILIDVGINRVKDRSEKGYKIVGDIHKKRVELIASHITPVPGGVGPMTIAMLVENTVEAAEKSVKRSEQ
ncbi:MAG: bifunctional 5,10-methylenetetrahydrofolate dehydrogenase/5,10-methenyltetrahydrofolate cyclohydrolase [Candidatus Neomarinimicrobiota bacterium]